MSDTPTQPGHPSQLAVLERWPVAIATVGLFSSLFCFLNLGGYALMSMEGMIIDGARSMMHSGNWWVPRVYGDVYTYKPAFAYWLSALPQSIAQAPSELALRAPFAGGGVLLAMGLLWLFGRLLGPRTGVFIALAATGGLLFLDKIRIAEFDGPIAVYTGLAIAAAVAALAVSGPRAGVPVATGALATPFSSAGAQAALWVAAYGFAFLGFIAKGVPALMVFGPGLLAAAFLTGNVRRLFRWDHILGAALFLGMVGFYIGSAVAVDGSAIFDQPAAEAGRRSVGWTLSTLGITLLKPVLILAAFMPWTLLLLRTKQTLIVLEPRARRVLLAALGFFCGGTLAFCVVSTHEMRYYLPLAAAAAISSGVIAESMVSRGSNPRSLLITIRVFLVLFVLGAIGTAVDRGLASAGLIVAILVPAGLSLLPSVRRSVVPQLVACSLVLTVAYAFVVMPGRALRRDTTEVAAVFDPLIPKDETVWMVAPSDHAGKHATLLHYLGREVRILPETLSESKPEAAIRFVIYTDERAHLLAKTHRVEDIKMVKHPYFNYHLARVLGRALDAASD